MNTPHALRANGIEQQFAANHFGHFVFTMGLLQKIKESQPSRIVLPSSLMHEQHSKGGIDFDSINNEKTSNSVARMAARSSPTSFSAKDPARRLKDELVYVNIVHLGYIATELNWSSQAIFGKMTVLLVEYVTKIVGMAPEDGALTQLYCVTRPEVENKVIHGKYFIPIANKLDPNDDLHERLWSWTENIVREKLKA